MSKQISDLRQPHSNFTPFGNIVYFAVTARLQWTVIITTIIQNLPTGGKQVCARNPSQCSKSRLEHKVATSVGGPSPWDSESHFLAGCPLPPFLR